MRELYKVSRRRSTAGTAGRVPAPPAAPPGSTAPAGEVTLNFVDTDIREMVIEWDSSYTTSLRKGYLVELFEKRGILNNHEFPLDIYVAAMRASHCPITDRYFGFALLIMNLIICGVAGTGKSFTVGLHAERRGGVIAPPRLLRDHSLPCSSGSCNPPPLRR
jgi:hypothetical protein